MHLSIRKQKAFAQNLLFRLTLQRNCGIIYELNKYAGVAELADALVLGTSVNDVQVQVLSPAPYRVFITCMKL